MKGSMEHIPRCPIGTIPNHDLLEPENGTRKTNCFMLSSRPGPCVSAVAPYVVNVHCSP